MTLDPSNDTRPVLSDGPVRIGEILPSVLADLLPPPPASDAPTRARKPPAEARPTLGMRQLERGDRPRNRALNCGIEKLTTQELLSLILEPAAGRGSLDISRDLLAAAGGSVRRLFVGDAATLCVRGVGRARLTQLRAAFELGRRWIQEESSSRPHMNSASDVVARVGPQMRNLSVAEFRLIPLDHERGMTRTIRLDHLDSCRARIQLRTIFHTAIIEDAESIVVVHNHPDGDPLPSEHDRELARRLTTYGCLTDIPLHDYIVIGHHGYTSLREDGWL